MGVCERAGGRDRTGQPRVVAGPGVWEAGSSGEEEVRQSGCVQSSLHTGSRWRRREDVCACGREDEIGVLAAGGCKRGGRKRSQSARPGLGKFNGCRQPVVHVRGIPERQGGRQQEELAREGEQ